MTTNALKKSQRPALTSTGKELRELVAQARAAGKTIGLAPTMGALHEGHLSLVRAAKEECGFTIVTIFVNPTQFAPHEDFGKYPRTLENDLDALAPLGVDLVFAPSAEEMYSPDFSTYVKPPRASLPLEGKCRPDHFQGVATVVLKLFNFAGAAIAYFGQKDYQQSLVIRRMVSDLNVPIEIRVCPTVREADGLALSSRNQYLSPSQRITALALSQSLNEGAKLIEQGECDPSVVSEKMRRILTAAGVDKIDYLALADPDTLEPQNDLQLPTIALIAAYVGETRLIDNRRLVPSSPSSPG